LFWFGTSSAEHKKESSKTYIPKICFFCKQIQSSGYLTLPNRFSQAPKKTHHPPLSLRRAESEQAQNRRTESARLVKDEGFCKPILCREVDFCSSLVVFSRLVKDDDWMSM